MFTTVYNEYVQFLVKQPLEISSTYQAFLVSDKKNVEDGIDNRGYDDGYEKNSTEKIPDDTGIS